MPSPERERLSERPPRARRGEIALALGAFALMCFVVVTTTSSLLEPDDYAYRASIAALLHGQIILSNSQYHHLLASLSTNGSPGILQWTHLSGNRWISEKNPGYPFFAVAFAWAHSLRLAPLFFGALGSLSLFVGARRWLGHWAGGYAVALFCTSGAALVFAWRSTMPTFTDASLIAAGLGLLLWAMLADDFPRRRVLVGLAAFVCLEGAVFIRYTNAVVLIVAALAALVLRRASRLRWRDVAGWMGSIVAFAAMDLIFNAMVYGGAFKTGYSTGEITFSLSSLWPNLIHMPGRLLFAMPMSLLALAAVVWCSVRLVESRTLEPSRRQRRQRDATVVAVLATAWASVWVLYLAYSWTVGQNGGGIDVHLIRFYLPAVGAIALLGAWTLRRLPVWVAMGLVAIIATWGVFDFYSLAHASGGPGGSQGPGPMGGPGVRSGPGGSGPIPGNPIIGGRYGGPPSGAPPALTH